MDEMQKVFLSSVSVLALQHKNIRNDSCEATCVVVRNKELHILQLQAMKLTEVVLLVGSSHSTKHHAGFLFSISECIQV